MGRKSIQMVEESDLTIEEGFELWKSNCIRRGLTLNTINYYHTVSNVFMGVVNYKTLISQINKKTIDDFVLKLMEKNMKITSLNTYLRGMRAIIYWWIDEKYIQEPFKVQKIRCDEEIKECFAKEDIKKLLKRPNIKKSSFLTYQSWVLCNVFYGLGCRASTLCDLKIEDLDLENKFIIYRKMKDRKQTILPLGDILVGVIKEFLVYRKGKPEDYVFVNYYGEHLIVDRMGETLNRYYKFKEVNKTGLHIWRRTFARDAVVLGMSSLKLQGQLCHKTLDMTKKYVNLYGSDLRDNEHNPLERLELTKPHMTLTKSKGGK